MYIKYTQFCMICMSAFVAGDTLKLLPKSSMNGTHSILNTLTFCWALERRFSERFSDEQARSFKH